MLLMENHFPLVNHRFLYQVSIGAFTIVFFLYFVLPLLCQKTKIPSICMYADARTYFESRFSYNFILQFVGHAFEARIYAENVARGFLPATGVLQYFRPVPVSETGMFLQ